MRLFCFHLDSVAVDSPDFELLLSYLDKEDQARVKRFRLPEDSLRCLVGRLAPIWYLRQESLLPDHRVLKIDRKGKGKPTMLEPCLNPPLAFNTSHDGSYVLFGVTRAYGSDIGVDIMEYPKDAWEVQEGISDQLANDEKALLALPMSEEERARLITRIWTFKEAYVKATGEGIVFGLERIRLDLTRDGKVHAVRVDGRDVKSDGWEWAFGTIDAEANERPYGWAVFWKKDAWSADLEHVKWKDFMTCFPDDKK